MVTSFFYDILVLYLTMEKQRGTYISIVRFVVFCALALMVLLSSCTSSKQLIYVETDLYELIIPEKHKEFLVLFPSFGGTIESVKKGSKLVEKALDVNIAVVIVKLNQDLFLNEEEQAEIGQVLLNVLIDNSGVEKDIYIGGFSSGGNLAMQTAKYLTNNQKVNLSIKGLLIVDSPLDLVQFYHNSKKLILKNNAKEAQCFIDYLDDRLGEMNSNLENYKLFSPCVNSIGYVENSKFKNTELVFYTEPASVFKKKNYQQDFKDTNSFQLQQLSEKLNALHYKVSYIETENKGYRDEDEGVHVPHSWSIIDVDAIMRWIKNKEMPLSNVLLLD
ncbi:MAG: hypothetical protein COB98_01550 [Flavobacteriaceae bacterium]|nr:MAG: hypothetical protein COB98_01550 [Flavobacteriaceae bacterium]